MASQPASVRVSVQVNSTPQAAFAAFTDDIDCWYRKDRHTLGDLSRAQCVRFEPGVGGRLVEIYDLDTAEGREMGRITAWEPGARLAFVDDLGTEVQVWFEAEGAGTRVTLQHSGLDRLRPELARQHARHGWHRLLPWYQQHAGSRSDPRSGT